MTIETMTLLGVLGWIGCVVLTCLWLRSTARADRTRQAEWQRDQYGPERRERLRQLQADFRRPAPKGFGTHGPKDAA